MELTDSEKRQILINQICSRYSPIEDTYYVVKINSNNLEQISEITKDNHISDIGKMIIIYPNGCFTVMEEDDFECFFEEI